MHAQRSRICRKTVRLRIDSQGPERGTQEVRAEGEGMMQRSMRWSRLRRAALLALSPSAYLICACLICACSLCPWPVQAESAAGLLDGTWSDIHYGCEHPWKISVTGDTVLFEVPFRRFPEHEFAYYSTEEKVVGTQDNVIDTVTTSMTSDDIVDVVGDRFTYIVDNDGGKFSIHEHRNNRDFVHVRCPAPKVASRGGPAPS
jgi:hypothetical protein